MEYQDQSIPTFCYDRLYQRVDFTPDDLKLFQTKEMTRLREVSLAAVPPWTMPTGICASKFEHSVGVGHLARIVTTKPEFQDLEKDLYFAGLAHDIGTPPFSHLSEAFLVKLFGVDHEEFVDEVFDGSEYAREVQRQGGSIDRVANFIKGKDKPLSDLVNGSIDIDNLDNTLRYGLSTGILDQKSYSPERLARAYSMRGDQLVLAPENPQDLPAWEACRAETYKFIYHPANLAAGMMIWRAVYLATQAGEITKDYFFMTDAQAYAYLEDKCNVATSTLMEQARRWHYYPRVFDFATTDPSDNLRTLCQTSWNRGPFVDELSQQLSIPPEHVSIYSGKDKGFKQIHLPIVSDNGDHQNHVPQQPLTWMAQVYVHTDSLPKTQAINEFMQDRIAH